jgi:phosphoribosyl-ATP pyrophosphohydrolase
MSFTLDALDQRLAVRAKASAEESYTARLLAAGVERCARKLGEEAVETVIAAVSGDRAGLVGESADLVYHLLVTLRAAGVPLGEVMAELERRTAQSGLEEKASRGNKADG